MSVCAIQGSFRVPADATVRLTRDDTSATVDWALTEGDEYTSAEQLVTAWRNTVQGSVSFAAFSIDTVSSLAAFTSTVTVTTGGPAWSVAWSHAGDGSAVRDWLGASGDIAGAADGATLGAPVPAAFVANYGARVVRQNTGRDRAHFVALDGSHQTQHHAASGAVDDAQVSAVIRWGSASAATYAGHEQLESCVDAIFDATGGGEPWTLFVCDETDDLATATQWLLRFATSPVELRPAQVHGSKRGQLWEIRIDGAVAG